MNLSFNDPPMKIIIPISGFLDTLNQGNCQVILDVEHFKLNSCECIYCRLSRMPIRPTIRQFPRNLLTVRLKLTRQKKRTNATHID